MGLKGLVRSAAAVGVLLAEGIGDTLRISLTPHPNGDRRDEVIATRELLQALEIRRFAPTVTACPGCGRTTGVTFQELAKRVQEHIDERMLHWAGRNPGVENLTVAVMGCLVNGPGESRAADIGISLAGTGETPRCPVYVDGDLAATIQGDVDSLADCFLEILDAYVEQKYSPR
jgi:(E)-4-hydroxy-3-methylbut-2-enyl-diphosphate synthase